MAIQNKCNRPITKSLKVAPGLIKSIFPFVREPSTVDHLSPVLCGKNARTVLIKCGREVFMRSWNLIQYSLKWEFVSKERINPFLITDYRAYSNLVWSGENIASITFLKMMNNHTKLSPIEYMDRWSRNTVYQPSSHALFFTIWSKAVRRRVFDFIKSVSVHRSMCRDNKTLKRLYVHR